MTTSEHISTIRTLMKEFTDDTLFTDEFIAGLLLSCRNAVYNMEIMNKKKKLSRFSYNSFCVSLEKDAFHDCSCIPASLGCKVLRSKIKLPKTLISPSGSLLMSVYTINGARIEYKRFLDRKLLSTHPVTAKKITYDIIDDYLVLFGNLDLVVVKVDGVWENPFDLSKIEDCTNNTICWNPLESEFPMEGIFTILVYEMVLKFMGVRTKEDESENAQNNNV